MKSMNIKQVRAPVNLFPMLPANRPHPRNQISTREGPRTGPILRGSTTHFVRFEHKTHPTDRITNYSQRRLESASLSIMYLAREPLTMRNDLRSIRPRSRYTALIEIYLRSPSDSVDRENIIERYDLLARLDICLRRPVFILFAVFTFRQP